jgi:hypothetical protein
MKSSVFAGLVAAFASLAAAYTTPTTGPAGNPISAPGLNDIVPVGKPYKITWAPTTTGTVTLVLLRGPSDNVVPMYPIVEKVPNSGSYEWTPSTSLENDVTHYGIQLIDDATGQYQYTTQFGISNPGGGSSVSSVSVASAVDTTSYTTPAASSDYPVSYSTSYATLTSCDCQATPTASDCTESATATATATPTAAVPTTAAPAGTYSPPAGSAPAGTGAPSGHSNNTLYTVPVPTKSSHASAVFSVPAAEYTGAGSQLRVGGALVAVVAGMVFALL